VKGRFFGLEKGGPGVPEGGTTTFGRHWHRTDVVKVEESCKEVGKVRFGEPMNWELTEGYGSKV